MHLSIIVATEDQKMEKFEAEYVLINLYFELVSWL